MNGFIRAAPLKGTRDEPAQMGALEKYIAIYSMSLNKWADRIRGDEGG